MRPECRFCAHLVGEFCRSREVFRGLWAARYPGKKADPTPCMACGRVVPPREKVYRLRPRGDIKPYHQEQVVGYLCQPCRRGLGRPQGYFTRIAEF